MNLCVYVFILFAIVNFVNKFGEIYQNVSNFSFVDFDDCSFGCAFKAAEQGKLCGKLARFLSSDVT